MEISIPSYVKTATEYLEKAGFECYAVGGCVRDSLLSKTPHDWDLCTNALPSEICRVFEGFHVIQTGLKHGTVTVRIEHQSLEITTFRTDGEYCGHRRPERVSFVTNLSEDLSRRDFTVNALAYNEKTGVVDAFGGKRDIENRVIRCVGNPRKRFDEDALRILRAMRFSSVLGFEIEKETADEIHRMKGLLSEISAERIREELLKLLCGQNVFKVLMEFRDVIGEIIPEITEQFDFLQRNPHHCYDVYTHTAKAVENIEKCQTLRLIMLLHDIGKPRVFTVDEKGVGHFKLHPTVGSRMAGEILSRLKFDNKTKAYVCAQIYDHDNRFPVMRKNVRRFISKHGFDFFFDHLKIRTADALAQSEYLREQKLRELEEKKKIGLELLEEQAQLTLNELSINGRDLLELGFSQGRDLKVILDGCLEAVVDETVANEKQTLQDYAKREFSNLLNKKGDL